jgi:hypothetical protein
VAGPLVHRGRHSGRRPELTRARPSGRSGARRLAAEAREASGRRGDPSGGLTSDGGAVRRTRDGGERSSVATIGVERLGARRGVASAVWRGGGGVHFIGPGGDGEEARRAAAVEY